MMSASEVMQRPVVTVCVDAALAEAMVPLAEHGYAALPVVDRSHRLVGMLTSGDVLRGQRDDTVTTVAEVMATPAQSVTIDQDLSDITRLLVGHGLRSIPVVDSEATVVGIVSRGDLLRLFLTPDDALQVSVQRRLDEYTGNRRWVAAVRHGEVSVYGVFADDSERRIAVALARTVPGARCIAVR
ncbi:MULTISPECIES: HPP family protein [unclassified Gordonia (in: high G+C Gram-positive bacteria)]|uniref:CBS domain-containing protein n=1 Tax=Gordonia TaxID=2053 RepID=UPI000990BE75|nr:MULTISPECIES: CBS domain-containing protein [unclassified Gordonia (in: high G+C Gram-positive bacteria)]MCX2756722.1 CBS domain-containing protein [Gordonia sp. 4N]MDT0224022.1 CBS domain-containing protein [Gordonia sp. AC31]